jgi:hypothetical protein
VEIEDCVFDGFNGSPQGGAIWGKATDIHLSRSRFEGQLGLEGGALWLEESSRATITGCTFNRNFGTDAQIRLSGFSTVAADHTILAFGTGSVLCDGTSSALLACCDVFGNDNGDWVGCLAGQETWNNNLHADPRFCDVLGLQSWLRSDSPCAGENNPECGQVGAEEVGCQAPVPVILVTWGQIKSIFR